jgi:serine protease DegQ
VEPQDVNEDIAQTFKLPDTQGSIIAGLQRGGPADKAGLQVGDVVVAVNTKPIRNTSELLSNVAALSPGNKATLSLIRDGRKTQVLVTVAERPAARAPLR